MYGGFSSWYKEYCMDASGGTFSAEDECNFVQIDSCRFCYDKIKDRIIAKVGSVVAIEDNYPVSKGHMLIIPKNHSSNYFELSDVEKHDADTLINEIRKNILADDPSITGFNIGMNCGESAGQTIFHTHIHLIPRRNGDTANPRGGVRGVIPDKMGY
jgi:diadenosine tetraphosphate (Ap4A) HIT family hydrolase